MSDGHKNVYMFLKYVNTLFTEKVMSLFPEDYYKSGITSYMIKMTCIHHDLQCEGERGEFTGCFASMLLSLVQCYDRRFLPNPFNKKQNIHQEITDPVRTEQEFSVYMLCN